MLIKEVERKKSTFEKKVKTNTQKFTRVESANHTNNNIQTKNLIFFIVDILKEFNNIHESIYEKPNIIAKIVSTHFGPRYGKDIEEQLIREAAEEDFEDSMDFYDRDQDV